jgi:amino acid transporter
MDSSVVSNFAFSFAIISVLTGVTTTYNTGLRYGGPASMTLGWLVVSAFNGCVALSMAEICSAYPTSGGLYYWSAKLAGEDWAPLASWVTGWYALLRFFFIQFNTSSSVNSLASQSCHR